MKKLALLFFLIPTMAMTQASSCADRKEVIEKLEARYGEQQFGVGYQSASAYFEIWLSSESGTWTILMTRSNGTTCLMASGTNWIMTKPEEENTDQQL